MPASTKEYQRLPGRGIRRQGFGTNLVSARRARLWLGQDHLLSVESQWFTEHYRRFYFSDIQAITIRKTVTGGIISGVLAFLSLFPLVGVVVTSDGLRIFYGILAGTLIFFLVLNSFFGPTAICHLRTAVQTEELPSLRRLRRARKVLARIRPFIVFAQGELPPPSVSPPLPLEPS